MGSHGLDRIRNEIDAEGNVSLVWEGIGKVESRLLASLLLVVAAIWPSFCYSLPLDFWKLLQAKDPGGPDWLGLLITGVGGAFTAGFTLMALVAAFLLAFRRQPERLTLKPGKLVYDAGSTALMQGGQGIGGLPLWRALLGRTQVEIPTEAFTGASVNTYRNLGYVALQAGKRRVRVGRWLRPNEQQQLVRILTDWQQNRPNASSWP
jgi:hypothetical protein